MKHFIFTLCFIPNIALAQFNNNGNVDDYWRRRAQNEAQLAASQAQQQQNRYGYTIVTRERPGFFGGDDYSETRVVPNNQYGQPQQMPFSPVELFQDHWAKQNKRNR